MLTIAWRSTPHEIACRNSLRAIHGARRTARRAGRRLNDRKSGSSATLHLDQAQAALAGEPLEGGVVLRPDVAVAHQIGLAGFDAAAPRYSDRARWRA